MAFGGQHKTPRTLERKELRVLKLAGGGDAFVSARDRKIGSHRSFLEVVTMAPCHGAQGALWRKDTPSHTLQGTWRKPFCAQEVPDTELYVRAGGPAARSALSAEALPSCHITCSHPAASPTHFLFRLEAAWSSRSLHVSGTYIFLQHPSYQALPSISSVISHPQLVLRQNLFGGRCLPAPGLDHMYR